MVKYFIAIAVCIAISGCVAEIESLGGNPFQEATTPGDNSSADDTGPNGNQAEDGLGNGDSSDGTVPEEAMPEETVPEETVPEETVPEETVPEETVPEETVPEETAPDGTTPDLPAEDDIDEGMHEEDAPIDPAPVDPETEVPAPEEDTTVWQHCAKEKQICSFSGTTTVRYGAADSWSTLTITESTVCSNDVFGDPISGTAKTCQVPDDVQLTEPEVLDPEPPVPPVVEPNAPPAGFTRWSDPASWGGPVPANNATVTIASGKRIWLDQNLTLASLKIEGELLCADQNLAITAGMIMVHGKMTCGTPSQPYTDNLTITLTGNKPANVAKDGSGMGTKLIGVMMGGVLNLHGEERTSWLQLDDTARAGDNQITLSEAPNWRAGDKLVITSTAKNYKEAETVTIKAINGRIVTLTANLKYRHFGEIQSYSNDERTWDVDTRAEVGLLSRNIKVVGDTGSAAEKYGAHVMVMVGSEAYLSGIEMTRVGQYGLKGRYPFHWHMALDATGQYIKNSSIHDSYNRCVTVHGTHNTVVADNVCFKHVGHGFFLEDGIEQGNLFDHNLGLWTIRPPEADALLETDFKQGPASRGPATFWISNANNTFTNNSAAGSDGLGYWYDTQDKVTGPSATLAEAKNYSPRKSTFGGFTGNTVHSSRMALSICSESSGRPGYQPANGNGALIKDFTVYYGGIGAIWPCNMYHRFENIMVLDTGDHSGISSAKAAFVSAFPAYIDDSLFVSNSKLAGNNPQPRAAFGIYDFGTKVTNSHFVNYSEDNAMSPLFVEVGGGVTFMFQGLSNITRDNSDLMLLTGGLSKESTSGNVIRDYDGSLSGRSGRWSIVPKSPLMKDSTCIASTAAKDEGVLCPYYYGQLMIKTGTINSLPSFPTTRTDLSGVSRNTSPHAARKFIKVFMPLNQSDYHHIVDFTTELTTGKLKALTKLELQMDYGLDGDTAMIGLKNLKPGAKITKSGWTQVNSLTALREHAGRAWYVTGNTMHIKFKTTGTSKAFGARDSVNVVF